MAAPEKVGTRAEYAEGERGSLEGAGQGHRAVSTDWPRHGNETWIEPASEANAGEPVPSAMISVMGPPPAEKNPEGRAKAQGREGPVGADTTVATGG